MLAKLRLNQSDTYQCKVVVEYITNMLVDFVQGRSHYLEIGSEQGDIDAWDDLVIKISETENIHCQIKRQTTDFSVSSVRRPYNNKKELVALSTLDVTLKSLGARLDSNSNIVSKFRLILPQGSIRIKNNLEVRHLLEFRNQIKDGITTTDGLEKLAQKDTSSENIFLWLTTWCGFKDWEHILKAFNLLSFEMEQLETQIETRIKDKLKLIFQESKVNEIYLLFLAYLNENSVFTGSIKPRQLLYLIKDRLLSSIAKWTLFQIEGSFWNISGIQDLENNNEIEKPAVIVPSFWTNGNPYVRTLKIYGDCQKNCPVSESLIRLSVHPMGSFNIICSKKPNWECFIKNKTGGTLGVSQNDFMDLRILEGLEHIYPSESKQLISTSDTNFYAKELNDEMYKNVFKLIDSAIINKFREMTNGNLRSEIESRWTLWKQSLEKSIDEQRQLFTKILHPKAEGKSICGEVRVGPKTVELLSDALMLLLVVSVCLADTHNQDWNSVTDKLKMTSIGLAYWSGPADSPKNLIEIDDDDGISNLLEAESSQIIIIPRSALTDAEVFKDDIFSDLTKLTLLTHTKYPKLLITKDRIFKRLLNNGDISDLKRYFQARIDKYEEIIENAVNNVVTGV